MSRGPVALQADDLEWRYPGAPVSTFVGLSLAIHAGEIVALLGPSGCGKTTLLRILAGLQAPTRGGIRLLGEPLRSPHPRAALVFQQPSLLPWLNALGNTSFGLSFRHQPRLTAAERGTRIAAALQAVGLQGKEHLYPAQLSGGMAQRVALARALARQPALLLADEPFSALDALTRSDMQQLLVNVVRQWNTAALLVTHDVDEALRVADRVVLIGGHPAGTVGSWAVARPGTGSAHSSGTEPAVARAEILAALQRMRGNSDCAATGALPPPFSSSPSILAEPAA